jgi:prepilin-type N-terminal cleavage/methylation domain-containing protein
MYNTLQRYQARHDGDDSELGFTLIELLIVIVVLGILAAVTVFALSGVTSKSAAAACNSDAATVNTAVAAFDAQTGYTAGQLGTVALPAPSAANLVPSYLQSFPSNPNHYIISIGNSAGNYGEVLVKAPPTTGVATLWTPGSAICAKAT